MRVLSLFSGCGGMDIGFDGDFRCLKRSINCKMHPDWIQYDFGEWVKVKKTSFDITFANDILPEAKTAWVNYFKNKINNAEKIYHLDSIVDLVKRSKNGEQIFPNDIDIVIGGFPCQDFSIAGKRLGFNSTKSHNGNLIIDEPSIENRGQLYMWMRDVISITKPKLFIAENVKGLTNLKNVKDIIEKDFSQAANGGYLVVPARVLQAADYGVPQSRERVIFFGFKKVALKNNALKLLSLEKIPEEYDPYPLPTHTFDKKNHILLEKIVTCQETFFDLSEPEISDDISQKKYSRAKYMGKSCQGQTEVKLDSIAPTIRSEHHGNIEFRRLSLEHGGTHIHELELGLAERRLTVRECARIQTFPDDYQFVTFNKDKKKNISASAAYKIIGNAVPCILAYNIAKRIEEKWNLFFKN